MHATSTHTANFLFIAVTPLKEGSAQSKGCAVWVGIVKSNGVARRASVNGLSDQNHLGYARGVERSSAMDEIGDVELVQQEHAIGRQGAKEKSEIQGDDGKSQLLVIGI
jgi:hypothetical protein